MSDETSVKDRFDEIAGLRFYGIIRIKREVRKKGEDPKYTDKAEVTIEQGFLANSLEELKQRANKVLDDMLEEQKKALGG